MAQARYSPVMPARRLVLRGVLGTLAVLLLIVLAAGATGAWWWWGSFPQPSGSRPLPGLGAAATVAYDARGVPEVTAASMDDAFAALGYLHGLHRPLQVEIRRRASNGSLHALAASLAGADEDALRYGFATDAIEDERALDADARRTCEAYVRGLNEGLAEAARRPNPLLRVARLAPAPWTVRDVLAFGRRFAADLSNAESEERARLRMLQAIGLEDAAVLWQAAFDEPFPPVPDGTKALLELAKGKPTARIPARSRTLGPAADDVAHGSNAWAVAPSRSASGSAMLAGDPHLGMELPALWFEVVLRWPGRIVAGASLAGTPGVIIGHGDAVAWSFTTAGFDDADLFLVEVDDVERPQRFRENGAWRAFEIEEHALEPPGEPARTVEIARAGPAVYAGPSGLPGHGFLLRWTSRETRGLYESLAGINRATSLEQALDAARRFPGPGQNLIVASRAGQIAHAVVGTWPRRALPGWDGRIPAPWPGSGAWAGLRAPEEMPVRVDPPEGFVFTANEPGLSARSGISGDFEPPWRAERVSAVLSGAPRMRPEDMSALQLDVTSGIAAGLQARVRACGTNGPAAELYLAWDRRLDGSGAPALHGALRASLGARMRTKTGFKRTGTTVFARSLPTLNLLRAARENPWLAAWFDDPATNWEEGPCEQLAAALDEAWQALRHSGGSDPAHWSWNARHPLALRSPFGIGPLARFFNAPVFPQPGDSDSPNALAGFAPKSVGAGPYEIGHGPSYRIVAWWDAGGAPRSMSTLPGGADEHPGSRHAFDRLVDYAAGRHETLLPREAAPTGTLRLEPDSRAE